MKVRFRPLRLAGAAVALVTAMVLTGGAPASAAGPVRAVLGSQSLDLSRGWGTAKACIVFSKTVVLNGMSFHSTHATSQALQPMQVVVSTSLQTSRSRCTPCRPRTRA